MGKRKTTVIVAEGAQDSELNKITSSMVKDILSNDLGLDTRITTLGHVQRGGNAVAYDRMLATLQGVEAVQAVLEATPSTPTPVITIRENKITRTSLMDAVRLTQEVTRAIQNKEFDRAMSMRDAEFKEYYDAFLITTETDQPEMLLPENKVCCSAPWLLQQLMGSSATANRICSRWSTRWRHERGNTSRGCLLSDARPYSNCNT